MRCVAFSGPDRSWWHFQRDYSLISRFCIFRPCVKQSRYFFLFLCVKTSSPRPITSVKGKWWRVRWWENKFGSTWRLKFGGKLKKKNPPESFCLTVPVKHGRNMFPRWFSEGFLFSPLWLSASVAVLSISGLPKGGVHEPTNCFTKTAERQ